MHHTLEVYERINRYESNAERNTLMAHHRFRSTPTGARYLGIIWCLVRRKPTHTTQLRDRQTVA